MPMRWLARPEADVPECQDWLSPWEVERLGRMRFTKRRNDYLVGRWTAKHALARLLGHTASLDTLRHIEIRNAADGAPEALVSGQPAPVEITMTDRAGWGVCALTSSTGRIGCDLELVEPRSDAFIRDYLTQPEQVAVNAAADLDQRYLLANLLWSAKESALKVLRTGLRRDTRSVEVHLESAPPRHGWSALSVATEEGPVFPGWWRRYNDFVLSLVASAWTAPPESLEEPSSLTRAAPSHAWMRSPLIVPPRTPAP